MAIYLPRDPRDALLQKMGEKIGQQYTDNRVKDLWKKGLEGGDSVESVYANVSGRNPELANKLMLAEKKKRLNAKLSPAYRDLETRLELPEGTIKNKEEYDIFSNQFQVMEKTKERKQEAELRAAELQELKDKQRRENLYENIPKTDEEEDTSQRVGSILGLSTKSDDTGTFSTGSYLSDNIYSPEELKEKGISSGTFMTVRINNRTNEMFVLGQDKVANQTFAIRGEVHERNRIRSEELSSSRVGAKVKEAMGLDALVAFKPALGLETWRVMNEWAEARPMPSGDENKPSIRATGAYGDLASLAKAYKVLFNEATMGPNRSQKDFDDIKEDIRQQLKDKHPALIGVPDGALDRLWSLISFGKDFPAEERASGFESVYSLLLKAVKLFKSEVTLDDDSAEVGAFE